MRKKKNHLLKLGLEKKKKIKKQRIETHVQLAHRHFCHSPIRIPPTQFSPNFEEKSFRWTQEENTRGPSSFSPIPLPTKHYSKSFPFSFCFSIIPKIHSTKHRKMLQFYKKYFFEKMTYFLENIVVEINKIVKTKFKCIHDKYFYFLL